MNAIPEPLRSLNDFISIAAVPAETVAALLDFALQQKKCFRDGRLAPVLQRKTLAMIFEKSSLRTRLSFEAAMTQLGGHAICLDRHHIELGQREAVQDVARVISRMCNGIMARTFSQQLVDDLAEHADVPVINGLTDRLHPCQAMADMLTIAEHLGQVAGKTIVFVGDGNNVARSLAWACAKLKANFINVGPEQYLLEADLLAELGALVTDCRFLRTTDPAEALTGADIVYTDTWISMGQEAEKEQRLRAFADYQVNRQMLQLAPARALVMHDLPAYRDVEITSDILDSPRSIIFDQAENRLHFQRALLQVLLADRV